MSLGIDVIIGVSSGAVCFACETAPVRVYNSGNRFKMIGADASTMQTYVTADARKVSCVIEMI
jgi:hypothetical protein